MYNTLLVRFAVSVRRILVTFKCKGKSLTCEWVLEKEHYKLSVKALQNHWRLQKTTCGNSCDLYESLFKLDQRKNRRKLTKSFSLVFLYWLIPWWKWTKGRVGGNWQNVPCFLCHIGLLPDGVRESWRKLIKCSLLSFLYWLTPWWTKKELRGKWLNVPWFLCHIVLFPDEPKKGWRK